MDKPKKKIAILDDDNFILDYFRLNLSAQYDIFVAKSYTELLQILSRSKPDYIVLDIIMPDKDGFEVANIIRSKEEHKDIPIVFMSGMLGEILEAKALEFENVNIVNKRINDITLASRMTKALCDIEKRA